MSALEVLAAVHAAFCTVMAIVSVRKGIKE